jgi:outer membrane receptor protein involved in Fe transport
VASHLPEFTADLVGNYEINDQWNVGATLYYVGQREAFRIPIARVVGVTESLDSFVDLNLDVNYKINPKLTAFLRGQNLTGGNYEYYLDYPVQNLQIMGGAVYKFDF